MVDEKVIQIAKRARKWTKEIAKNDIDETNRKTLRCYCAIGSAYLHLLLKKHGYNSSIVMTQTGTLTHCFIKINNVVLDITGSQFNKKPIYIRKTFKEYWRIERVFNTIEDFFIEEKYWPKEQQFSTHLNKVEPEILQNTSLV